MHLWSIFFIGGIFTAYGASRIARDRGHDSFLWPFIGWALGLVGLFLVWLFLSDNYKKERAVYSPENRAKADEETLSKGGWRCICGRVNPAHYGTCACGNSKYNMQPQTMERIAAPSMGAPKEDWICSCGRSNKSYVGTCACGRSKNAPIGYVPDISEPEPETDLKTVTLSEMEIEDHISQMESNMTSSTLRDNEMDQEEKKNKLKHEITYQFEQNRLRNSFFNGQIDFICEVLNNKDHVFNMIDNMFQVVNMANPYEKGDFIVEEGKVDEDTMVIKITFPKPEEELLCFFAFLFFDSNVQKLEYFCIERKSIFGNMEAFICSRSRDGTHFNYGTASITDDEAYNKCKEIYLAKYS